MALTIEQAQKLSEFRVRFSNNVAAGKLPEDGFTQEELTEGLAILRGGKNSSAAAAAEKAKPKGKKAKIAKEASEVKIDTSKFMGGLDLDDDDE